MDPLPALLMEVGSHQVEVAETLIGVGRFLVIFVAARAMAELMVRLQLPTILGELVAGVLIGVSGLHLVLPPETQAQLSGAVLGLVGSLADVSPETVTSVYRETFPSLQAVSQIGLYALLFLTGLESELDELVAVGVQAGTVALTGVLLPFALGTAGLYYLFHVPLIPAVFAGAAMTATSIGITASVFGELQWLKRKEGQIVIGAAVLDDILGIVILAVVVALAGGGAFTIGPILKLCAAALVFVAAALFLSRTAAPVFDWVVDRLKAPGDVAVASFVVLTLSCFAAQAIGLEAALGAFAAGLILSASKHTHDIDAAVKPLVALFATVFFVLIGTGMDLSVLNPFDPANREGLIVAVFLLVVAVVGKVAAGWSYISKEPSNRLVVGLGMMPRGEVGLIFLGLGTQAGILTPALEAAILLMVIGTTFLAPILLRLVIGAKPVPAPQPS
ncbi:cation:proton antiporter [Synechococcus sp. CCY9201]|uniref:cation:proton antiporter n=1 Tax=unclassified Synechococcus TaxID=2626047 RepID=UPI0018CE8E3B|nr:MULTISPECIES: cation:proton antiporter [unclassified Synechococcus]MEA5423353.1 cation:proton antiporter [Synechococcus sp. CCY9202]MEA5473216.1 cation:proton antiporter [Synechococcus sp. CCY9201]QPN60519.1 cation:proton antiporter [Synechococcus sp. CBW1002]QPN67772.1 cation:proton antiporter [Synechococcus sp. CBW1006]CAK6688643.1 High-affinity Na(+)/H(+) antiporter NhaS3 [Synechococcus sp. CBW1107]